MVMHHIVERTGSLTAADDEQHRFALRIQSGKRKALFTASTGQRRTNGRTGEHRFLLRQLLYRFLKGRTDAVGKWRTQLIGQTGR